MKYKNLEQFPPSIRNAILNDDYSSGELTDISVTRLIDAPQVSHLRKHYHNQMETDARRSIAPLLGKAFHAYMEKYAVGKGEERLYTDVNGTMVSGQIDLQTEESGDLVLSDYKTWKVIQVQMPKPEAERQLNLYAALCRANGRDPKKLQVIAILKDWSEGKADEDPSYPQSPVAVIPIPMWSAAAALSYLRDRVVLHNHPTLPCTDEERWKRPERWYVKEPGKIRRKGFPSVDEAKSYLLQITGKGIIEKDGGNYTRCEKDYCGVAKWCPQYNGELDPLGGGSAEESE